MTATWRALLGTHPTLELGHGCANYGLGQAEKIIGQMPRELAGFLREVNGVFDQGGQWHVGWPLNRIVAERQGPSYGREELGRLLAFGDNGTGEPFCVPTGASDAATTPVCHWSFIDGQATILAPSLHQFWAGWISGSIIT